MYADKEGKMQTLKVAIDLGSDTVKVAYAYKEGDNVEYGKLAERDITGSIITPAIAYFDEDKGRWYFGEDVYKSTDRPFITVVKIKSLLSLLLRKSDKKIFLSNKEYYFTKYDFPKFYFPVKKKVSSNLQEAVSLDMTFKADITPQKVCESFFDYLAQNCVLPAIERLKQSKGLQFDTVDYTVVYPAKAGKEYIEELTRLVEYSFGKAPQVVLSATKALGLYAYHRGVLKGEEQLIIVDMGEEDISVAKLSISSDGKTVLVDGVDGHNEPMDIGGNDIDYAVRDFIEQKVSERETLGIPEDMPDFVAEQGMHSKQFLLMSEIKKAKTALSLPDAVFDNVFPKGVPLSFQRDIVIQRKITREDFCKCIGISDNDKIAGQISDYIFTELSRSINSKVSKLVLSGGVAETYGIVRFIKKIIAQNHFDIQVVTFDDYENRDDGFRIMSYEDSVYAPAVGGAVVALMGYEIKTIVALSYGTWQYRKYGDKYKKILDIFLKKGTVLPKNGGVYSVNSCLKYVDKWEKCVLNEEIFSTTSVQTTEIGEPDSYIRKKAENDIELKVVSGGKSKGTIYFFQRERNNTYTPVEIKGKLYFKEGVRIDGDGRATPFIENDLERNGATNTILVRPVANTFQTRYSYFKDIILKFSGVDEFDVEGSD